MCMYICFNDNNYTPRRKIEEEGGEKKKAEPTIITITTSLTTVILHRIVIISIIHCGNHIYITITRSTCTLPWEQHYLMS